MKSERVLTMSPYVLFKNKAGLVYIFSTKESGVTLQDSGFEDLDIIKPVLY